MVGVCFFFENNDIDVWSGRRIDLDAWNYAIKAAGDINKMIVINKTDQIIITPDIEMDFQSVKEIPIFGDEEKIVFICCPWDKMNKSISLWDFNHNVDWYIFGPANGWKKTIDFGVFIPQAGEAALHATHVASTVFFHRYEVLWRSH